MLKEADIVFVMGVLVLSVIIVNMYHDYLYIRFALTNKHNKKKQITMVICFLGSWAFAHWNSHYEIPGSILMIFFMYAAAISGSAYCGAVLLIVSKYDDIEKKHLRFYAMYLLIVSAVRVMSFIITELELQHRVNSLLN